MQQPDRSNIGNQLRLIIIGLFIFTLAACSSDDNSSSATTGQQRPTSVPELNSSTTFNGPLVKAGASSVSQFIKNGIYSATYDYGYYSNLDTSAPPASPNIENSDSDSGFSNTNNQEVGVDEIDRVKYNGSALYLSANAEWQNGQQVPPHIRVLERQNDQSLAQVAQIAIDETFVNVEGIYQHNDNLAVLSNNEAMYSLYSFAPEPWFVADNKMSLDIYDTTIPASPVEKGHIKIDGTMLSSRRIGDNLYIVNGYTATVEGLNPNASTDVELLQNYLKILDTPETELMPKIYFDDGQVFALNQPEDCAIPAQATDKDGYSHLLTVIRINLLDLSDYSASCISSVAEVMYMSQQNLYLTSSRNNQTIIHKVSLDENLTYQASGSVEGIIGWRSAPNLRLSEYDNHLRIVSSDYTSGEPVHQLSLLAQQGNQLEVVGSLPNDLAPDPIGKPGEDIYAVRFFADRAYIVTFERIDPLYVIDLVVPTAPKILGALEIPGFSNYLHPLDNGFLLGVGQQVNLQNLPEDDTQPTEPVVEEGMKVSLFDISDPGTPVEVNSLITPNSYTPVEYDYHALSVLNTNGSYKFAMPLERWGTDILSDDIWGWENSLLMLEVDTKASQPALLKRGEMVIQPNNQHYFYAGLDRSVIHGATVYYIHGNQVWRSLWEQNADLFGPY